RLSATECGGTAGLGVGRWCVLAKAGARARCRRCGSQEPNSPEIRPASAAGCRRSDDAEQVDIAAWFFVTQWRLHITTPVGGFVGVLCVVQRSSNQFRAGEGGHALCAPKTSTECDAALESPKLAG